MQATKQQNQLLNLLTLLQTKQTLETLEDLKTYEEFCYQLYLLATYKAGAKYTHYLGKAYEEETEGNTVKQIAYISLGGKTIGTHIEVLDTTYEDNPSNPNYKESYNQYFHTDVKGTG